MTEPKSEMAPEVSPRSLVQGGDSERKGSDTTPSESEGEGVAPNNEGGTSAPEREGFGWDGLANAVPMLLLGKAGLASVLAGWLVGYISDPDVLRNPHKPLLHDGEGELQRWLYQAVVDGDVALVGEDGEVLQVTQVGDINLNLNIVRLQLPPPPKCDICGQMASECPGHAPSVCAECGQTECECDRSPTHCSKCGHSPCQCPEPPPNRWRVSFNATASFDSDEGKVDLAYLLRKLANLIEEGKVGYINQMAQLIVACDQDDIDTIEQLAKDAGISINVGRA